MKGNPTLAEVAARYRCTLSRAAHEVLAASGQVPRAYPAAIRRQSIPPRLVAVSRAYLDRKARQRAATPNH